MVEPAGPLVSAAPSSAASASSSTTDAAPGEIVYTSSSLQGLNVKDGLRPIAKELGVTRYDALTKAQLISEIIKAQQARLSTAAPS